MCLDILRRGFLPGLYGQGLRTLIFSLFLLYDCAWAGVEQVGVVKASESISEVRRICGTNAGAWVSLSGSVRSINKAHSLLLLEDESGASLVQVKVGNREIRVGQRIRIEGFCFCNREMINFQARAIVDNDGPHSRIEKSGSVLLNAGRIPFRVKYYNVSGESGLTLDYQGPDIPRQSVPSNMLVRIENNTATGSMSWVQGLQYRCYEGKWERLPDFDSLGEVKAGRVATLDLGVRTRMDDIGLEFTGYLEVPRTGIYTFYLGSDDGSQLFLGSDQADIEVLGQSTLSPPRRIALGQVMGEQEKSAWVEVEGMVSFAGQDQGRMILDLSSTTGLMTAVLDDPMPGLRLLAPKSRIQARGLCQEVIDETGHRVAGRLFVFSHADLTVLSVPQERWQEISRTQIASLGRSNWTKTVENVIHIEGNALPAKKGGVQFLRDDTGEVGVLGLPILEEGARVAVLAALERQGTNITLRNITHRTRGGLALDDEEEFVPTLTTVEEARQLTHEEAVRSYPVRVRGVRTYYEGNMGMIQDVTGGIYVYDFPADIQPGDYVELEGITDPGGFAPCIRAKKCRYLGTGPFPDPLHPSWEQIMSGALDSQWVEIKGLALTGTNLERDLTVSMKDGDIRVEFVQAAPDRSSLEGAIVRVRGTVHCKFEENTRRLLYGFVRIQDMSQVTVETRRVGDISDVPSKRVAGLKMFDPRISPFKPLKVSGLVVHLRGQTGTLMDGTNGLRFVLREKAPIALGDEVEVAGFPGLNGRTPLLRNAIARKVRTSKLPAPIVLDGNAVSSGNFDATLIQTEARLVNCNGTGSEQVLELELGQRLLTARLAVAAGQWMPAPVGSRLRLTGVLASQTRVGGSNSDSYDLLLSSPADIAVLERPSWWTLTHALMVMIALLAVLLAALSWIRTLRHNVKERTQQLQQEIEHHKRTESKLEEKTELLEDEIEERKCLELEKERIHKELLTTSRQAGMAEVATGVLHNVGNVLNSVNISASLLIEKVQRSKSANITKVAGLLNENSSDLATFLVQDEKGRKIPAYLNSLADNIAQERQEMQKELACLRGNVDHIKEIVAMQQSFARVSGIMETVAPREIVEDALKMQSGSNLWKSVRLERQFEEVPVITTDKHKVLQILVNLLQNAKHACDESGKDDKQVVIRIAKKGDQWVKIEVADNGAGIKPENLTKIFVHGFTTKKDGHGFGLHSGALAAKELGGALTVHSEGPGKGAAFSLELPLLATNQ